MLNRRLYELTVAVLLVIAILEAISLLTWTLFPLLGDTGTIFTALDTDAFDLLAPFSPLLLVLGLYAWIFEGASVFGLHTRLIHQTVTLLLKARDRLLRWIIGSAPRNEFGNGPLRNPRIWLFLISAFAVLVVYIPYRSDLNPGLALIGTDTPLYVGWIDQMRMSSLTQAMSYALGIANHGSRPFLLIPLYLVTVASGVSSVQSVEFLPLLLAPLSALSSYVLMRTGSRSETIALLAMLFTVTSFPVTVGMWAGYYANWLALIEANLFFASLLLVCRSFSSLQYTMFVGLSLALLLTHPWTWALVIVVALAFCLSMWKTIRGRGIMTLLAPMLATDLIVDALKTYTFGSWGLATYIGVRVSGSGPLQSAGLWQNLIQAMVFTYDGLLSNALILLLAFVAVLNLRFSDAFDRLILLWISIPSLIFPILESYNQTRIIYDLPIPILASVGAILFVSRFNRTKRLPWLVLVPILLFNTNYALRAMAHLVTGFQ